MSKRAKFQTNKGLVTLSRNTLTIANGDTGETEVHHTVAKPVINRDVLKVEVRGGGPFFFTVEKTPAQLKEESLRAFAPKELSRLKKLGDEEAVKAFEKKYHNYLQGRV